MGAERERNTGDGPAVSLSACFARPPRAAKAVFRNEFCTCSAVKPAAVPLNSVLTDLHVWEFVHYDDGTWRWRKLTSDSATVLLESPRCFDALDDCIKDAEESGFGALPH
jgi:hypothetical protein